MATNGYVPLRRGIIEHLHAMTGNELKLYVTLLCLADHRTGRVSIALGDLCEIVELPKSSVSSALRSLAEPHNSKGTRYISYTPSSNQFGLTSVLVLKYQKNSRSEGVLFAPLDSTCTAPVQHTHSDLRKEAPNNQKKVEEKNIVQGERFEEWWRAYPRKQGKGAARAAYLKALTKTDAASLLAGVARYTRSKTVLDGFVCLPSTWLNQERWDDDYTDQKKEVQW